MRILAGVCAVLVVACGGGDREYHFQHKLDTKGSRTEGLPIRQQRYLDAKPKLGIVGVTGAIEKGMRARLERDGTVKKGAVEVTVALTPAAPDPGRGHVELTIQIGAVFLAAPKLFRIDNTITGTLDYTGGTLEQIGEQLGAFVADDLAKEKLPANTGFPTSPPPKVTAVETGQPSCTLHEDGSVRCWDRYSEAILVPEAGNAIAVDAAENYGACVLKKDGTVWCIDAFNGASNLEVRRVCGVDNAKSISVGAGTACALLADGHVKCWPGTPASFAPCDKQAAVEIKNVTDAVSIFSGPFEGCTIGKDGRARCWEHCGDGCKSSARGEIDLATAPSAAVVKGLPPATRVVSEFFPCVAHDKTKITCIDPSKPKPKPRTATLPDEITQLVATMGVCALDTKGAVTCWGTEDQPPQTLAAPTDVVYLTGGLSGTCAITRANDVLCWGGIDHVGPDKATKLSLF